MPATLPGLVHDGNYLVKWVPTLTTPGAPKLTELNNASAIALECQITPDGLSREASDEAVDTSRLCSVFSTQRVGRTSYEVAVTLVRLDTNAVGVTADPAYSSMVKNQLGYLVIRDNKPATAALAIGDKVEVYYCELGSRSKATPAANEQMTFTIPMMVLDDPKLDVAIVA